MWKVLNRAQRSNQKGLNILILLEYGGIEQRMRGKQFWEKFKDTKGRKSTDENWFEWGKLPSTMQRTKIH